MSEEEYQKNIDSNKEIMERLQDIINVSPEANFQKILYLSGVTELYQIMIDDEMVYVGGADTEERSHITLERVRANIN